MVLKLISRIGKNGNAMNSTMNMNTMRSICSFLCFQQLTMLCLLIQLVTKALFVCQTWRERESQSLQLICLLSFQQNGREIRASGF